MKRLLLWLLPLALALPAAAAAASPAPPVRSALARAITLTEVPEAQGTTPPAFPFGTEAQDVDVNSTIRIRISPNDLLGALPAALKTGPAQDADLLLRSSRDLQKASASLASSIQSATAFALGLKQGRPPAELTKLAAQDDAQLKLMIDLVKGYKTSLATSPNPVYQQHAEDARQRANRAVESGSNFAVSAFLVDELQWTLDQLAAADRRLAADAPPVALVLSAVHIHDGKEVELGLPHYNDLPIGVPKSIDKTTLVLTPEEQKRVTDLEAQYAALAKVLNEAVAGSAELKDVLRQLLQSQGIDIAALETALDNVSKDVDGLRTTDWDAVAKKLEDQARGILNGAVAEADKKILNDKVLPAILALRAGAADARTTLEGLRAQAGALRAALAEGSDLSKDPTAALVRILTLADSLAGEGKSLQALLADIGRWEQTVKALQAEAKTVGDTLAGLSQGVKAQIQALLTQTAQAQIGDLVTHLGQLRAAAEQAIQQAQSLVDRTRGAAELAASLDREPPPAAFHVPFGEIQSTWLDLRTLNPRAEDDVVVLRAWLYRIEKVAGSPGTVVAKEQLASDVQQLRLLRFGWYTGPSVGLVYTSALDKLKGQDKETRAFAPLVAFLWHHRSWDRGGGGDFPLRARTTWKDSFGVGLHTIMLDLDKDNQQEIGLGLGISFFNGYLQIGGGIDLGLQQQKYVFIGTRIFDFTRAIGMTVKPAAPVQ
jgi:hypothetical protein